MRKFLLSIFVVLVWGFFAFSVYLMNQEQTMTFKYIFGIEWTGHIATYMFVTFILGMLIGALIVSLSLFGQKLKTGKANRQLKKVEKEVEGLRAAVPEQV